MEAYEEERKEAKKKFLKDMATAFADAATTAIAPEAYFANKVVQAALTVDASKAVNNSFKLYKKLDGSDPKNRIEKIKMGGVGLVSDSLSSIFENLEKLSEIDVKEDKAKFDRIQDYTNQGAWYLKKGSVKDKDSSIYTDFNADLRKRELDNNGLKGYINSSDIDLGGQSVENYIDKKIDDMNANFDKEDQISDKVKKYAKGEGGLTLEEMSAEELKQLDSIAIDIQDAGGSKLGEYLNSTFEIGDKK